MIRFAKTFIAPFSKAFPVSVLMQYMDGLSEERERISCSSSVFLNSMFLLISIHWQESSSSIGERDGLRLYFLFFLNACQALKLDFLFLKTGKL